MIRSIRLLVSGRVQGVYFRVFTQKKAKQLDIKGCVKNLPDGRVEIKAQADNNALEPFIKWCQQGPVTARVDHVEMLELESTEIFTSFEIR
ncbi:MAG: acylphosphatase [Methylococcaceae bacterium]